jgi:CO/xanthine dehydrogenase FAD-binding subunit
MKPAQFEYHAPHDISEALALLGRFGGDAKVLAGGQSLVPLMNFRLARPAHVIDINGLAGLADVHVNGGVRIGALTRQRQLEAPTIPDGGTLLRDATLLIGHPGIRNRGTIGGSIAHNDPAAEYPAALLALDATVIARSTRGDREVLVDELLGEWLSTSLEPDEILVSVGLPALPKGSRFAIAELAKRRGDFALSGAVVRLDLAPTGLIADARVVAFGGLPRATRMSAAERILVGATPGEEAFREAADAAEEWADPTEDIHASREFRKHLTRVLTLRALRSAIAKEA